MRLVYSFNINNLNEILSLCKISKDLYNQALYEVKENLKVNKFLFYHDLNRIMINKTNLENNINYRLLKAQVSQQILKQLDKDLKSYYKSIKLYKKDKTKFKGIPKLPNYKSKYNNLIYTNQCSKIKDGYIHLSKQLKIFIPQWEKYKNLIADFNQVRIIPKNGYIKIEIIYSATIQNTELLPDKFVSIDLGIDNLVSMVGEDDNIILSGKQIKSINQNFNKKIGKLQSIKDKQKNKKSTKKILKLYENRNNVLSDIFHKVSRFVVNNLIENKTGNLVIGYNKNWKDSISLGKRTNQKFVQIPYLKLINYLQYKCDMVGIKLIITEESYTSKCDSLAMEQVGKHKTYAGKRVKRGLFQSSTGRLINADINGSLNIMRKVVDDSYTNKIINRGLLFNPIKIRDLFNINSNFLLRKVVNFKTF